MKLIEGGIYNILDIDNCLFEEYCVVIKQGYDYIIYIPLLKMFLPRMMFDDVNTQKEINKIVDLNLSFNRIKEDYCMKISNLKDNQVTGYLGKINDEYLQQLRLIAVAKYPYI